MYHSLCLLSLFLVKLHAEDSVRRVDETILDGSSSRIIGGTDVPFGKYPWFAKARIGSGWGGKKNKY